MPITRRGISAPAGRMRRWLPAVLMLQAALIGCGGPSPLQPGAPTAAPVVDVATDPSLAAQVPAQLREAGELRIATDPVYQPLEYLDSQGRLTGVEVQLVMAVAELLDLTPVFAIEAYSGVAGQVVAGRFDIGAVGVNVSPGQTLDTDAVRYLDTDFRLVRPIGSQLALDDLCGERIAAQEGSRALQLLAKQSASCRDDGRRPITIDAEFTREALSRAVLTGRAAGLLAEEQVVAAVVRSYPGELQVAPGATNPASFVLLADPAQGMAPLVVAAIDALIASGDYAAILRSFGVTTGYVDAAQVLPARTPLPDPAAG